MSDYYVGNKLFTMSPKHKEQYEKIEKALRHEEHLYSQKKIECQLLDIENAKLKKYLFELIRTAEELYTYPSLISASHLPYMQMKEGEFRISLFKNDLGKAKEYLEGITTAQGETEPPHEKE